MEKNIKINNTYAYFDDGKIKVSRKHDVTIVDIIPFDEIYHDILELWKEEVCLSSHLYSKETDFFLKGILDIDDNKTEEIYFVRTLDNGWFSLGFWGGRLDVDGSLTKKLNDYLLGK